MSFLLFTLPSKTFVNTFNLNDKFVHALLFASGAVCWGLSEKKAILKILFWLVFYGIAVEFIQEIILPNSFHRGGDIYDAIADSIGVLIGVGLVKMIDLYSFK